MSEPTDRRQSTLRRTADAPFFAAISDSARDALRASGRRHQIDAGRPLAHQGDLGRMLWVIESGLVLATATHPSGHEAILGLRGDGELVGELAVLDGRPRSATVTALRPTVALAVAGDDFDDLLARDPTVSRALVDGLVARLRQADEMRIDQAAERVPVRLARCLLDLVDRYGASGDEDGAGRIELPLSQEDLAGLVGASRDAVAKTLKGWREAGLITTGRRRLGILDPAGLAERAR